MEEEFSLDDQARLALDVARHASLANGDSYCGTEYVLYGLVATARGELVELVDMFALNTLRIDRAIERILEQRQREGMLVAGPPQLSRRARSALETPRLDGDGPAGVFEVLHGLIVDDDSGACRVLRDLGVMPEEARRLVGYGMRHLSRDEIDALLDTLDRRDTDHRPWWGPDPDAALVPHPFVDASGSDAAVRLASSESAVVELVGMGTDGAGVGFSIRVSSTRNWVLPPVFVPEESLVPGSGATFAAGPDLLLVQLVMPDGTSVDNRAVHDRYDGTRPADPRLLLLGHRQQRTVLNDRRRPEQHVITSDWWLWPLPTPGVVEVRIDWPAESVTGTWSFDAGTLVGGSRSG